MNYNEKFFAKNLKNRRTSLGMTQKDLATLIGCNRANISTIENSVQTTNIKTFSKICKALNCTPNDLLGGY